MACATSSFPVPVSPSIRTVESVEATCSTCSRTDSRAALLPIIRSNLRSGCFSPGYAKVSCSGIEVSYHSNDCLAVRSQIKCGTDRFDHQLMIERFRQELDRTLSHRLNPHPGVSESSDEDDRDIALLFFQPGLQVPTRHLRHEDVSYQTCDLGVQTGFEEFFRGSEASSHEPSRLH